MYVHCENFFTGVASLLLLDYLVFYACYALAGFYMLTTVTAACLRFVPRAERTGNMTAKPKGAKNKDHMLSYQSFERILQPYVSWSCEYVPKTAVLLCAELQPYRSTGAGRDLSGTSSDHDGCCVMSWALREVESSLNWTEVILWPQLVSLVALL